MGGFKLDLDYKTAVFMYSDWRASFYGAIAMCGAAIFASSHFADAEAARRQACGSVYMGAARCVNLDTRHYKKSEERFRNQGLAVFWM